MELYRVSFIGHRELDTREHFFIEEKLLSIVRELIETTGYVEFYVVRDYDGAAQCLHKAIAYGIEIKRVDEEQD